MTDTPVQAVSRKRFTTGQMLDLWKSGVQRFQESRKRIIECSNFRQASDALALDDAQAHGELMAHRAPQRQTIEANVVNSLTSEPPVIRRVPISSTATGRMDADKLEQWLRAMMAEYVDWSELVGKATEDGTFGILCMLDSYDYFKARPRYQDERGDDEYAAMSDEDRHGYRKLSEKEPYQRPRSMWWRTASGEPADKPHAMDERRTRQAWEDADKMALAENPPFVVRLLSATDAYPILVRGRKRQRWECRGVVIRTLYEREELVNVLGMRWKGMDQGATMIPHGYESSPDPVTGRNGMTYLYEAHLIDDQGPYIAYSVAGLGTWHESDPGRDDDACVIVDLKKECGQDRLLAQWFDGMHTHGDNPATRGYPLVWPITQLIKNTELVKTAVIAHVDEYGFTGMVVDPNPDIIKETPGLWMNAAKTKAAALVVPKRGEVALYPGKHAPFAAPSMSDDAKFLLADMANDLQMTEPAPENFGGAEGDSGRALIVMHDLLKSAKRQIPDGCKDAYGFVAESLLYLATLWHRMHGYPVPALADEERIDGGETTRRQVTLELNERWVGDNFKVKAEFQKVGSLPEVQQGVEMWKAAAISWAEMRERMGDESPESSRITIDAERLRMSDPTIQMMIAKGVYEMLGAQDKADAADAQLRGLLMPPVTGGLDGGMPTDAVPPELRDLMGGGQAQAGTGMTSPDIAQASLNGIVSGALGSGADVQDAMAGVPVG